MATLSEQLKKSVMSLARTNNGYFKSENQKTFLIEHLGMYEGLLGYTSGIKYKNPIFADYDSNGITKIYKRMMSSNKIEIIFERKIEGELTSIEVKVLSSFKRKLKKLEKELENRLIFFLPEKHNIVDNRSKDEIEKYDRDTNEKLGVIEYIKSEIARLEK
ncbi:MAG: hypothetical protein K9I82_04310 [Chitinophagaceae bacterium]|nr:hypothetical protein [Chitinophagaceae bacterium]